MWPQGLRTKYVTEDKVWGFLFDQAHQAKSKHRGRLKSGETRISAINFDTKDCAVLLSRSLTGNTVIQRKMNFLLYCPLYVKHL